MEKCVRFSKGEALRFGWQAMKENFWFFVGAGIVAVIVVMIPSMLSELLAKKLSVFSIILTIVGMVLQIGIGLGAIKIALKLCDWEDVGIGDLFSCFHLVFKSLISNILAGLIVFIGFCLLIVPGIIWGIKLQFAGYLIVDKGIGPINALESSWKMTKGVKWNLCVFGILLVLINILGVLCLFLGLFVTVPMTMVAMAFVYRRLLTNAEDTQVLSEPISL